MGFGRDSYHEVVVKVSVCPPGGCQGEHVYIDSASNHYGPSGYSQCSKNETSTDFYPKSNGELRVVKMTAIASSLSCVSTASWNTWILEVYRNKQMVGRGVIWLGQDRAGSGYYSACDPSNSPWKPAWQKLTCQRLAGGSLQVAEPGAVPYHPNCPSTGPLCRVDVHLDATAYCPNITASAGGCFGKSTGTALWTTVFRTDAGMFSGFSWTAVGSKLAVRYAAVNAAVPTAVIDGTMSSPHSNALVVTDAFNLTWQHPGQHWSTKGEGQGSQPPGEPGGPLYVQFENGKVGADVYIRGYLERK